MLSWRDSSVKCPVGSEPSAYLASMEAYLWLVSYTPASN